MSAAGRLSDALEREFGRDQIFRDVETIEPGADFVAAIDRALSSCSVMLVVIGPRWLSLADRQGFDWARAETARGLARGIRLIPVLVEGAAQILPAQLPPDLQALAVRQSHELSDTRWDYDVQQLVAAISRVPGIQRRAAPALANILGAAAPKMPTFKARKVALWAAGIFIVGAVLAAIEGALENRSNLQMPGMAASVCACGANYNPGAVAPDPHCASGLALVQQCSPMICPDGRFPTQAICE
jgi:TIR domain